MNITIEELDEEFKPYRNDYGFVSDGRNNLDHNPLFHGFYVSLKARLGLLTKKQIFREKLLIETLIHPEVSGLLRSAPYNRPNSNSHSHDNERAMFWLSKRLGMTYAADFLAHGRETGWNYNSNAPFEWTIDGTYERFTGIITQAMIAAGERPGVYRSAWLILEILGSANTKRQHIETMTLPYFMCKTIRGHNGFIDGACDHWKQKGFKKYPRGIGEVFQSWGGTWETHPYVKWYQGVIDV